MGARRITTGQAVFVVVLFVAAVLALMWLLFWRDNDDSGPSQSGGPKDSDAYVAGDVKVPISIALNKVGIVARDGVTEDQLRKVAAELGGDLKSLGQSIYIVDELDGERSRRETDELARQARERNETILAHAGIVVTLDDDPTWPPLIISDRLIVTIDPRADAADRKRLLAGVEVVEQNPYLRGQYLVRAPDGSDALEVANRLRGEPGVRSSTPDFITPIDYRQSAGASLKELQWYLENDGSGVGFTSDADIDADFAQRFGLGTGVTLAVLDTGIDLEHSDLKANVEGSRNYFGTGQSLVDPHVNGHGTAAASLALARDANGGLLGVCPRCDLLAIRLPIVKYEAGKALGYAAQQGADVVSASWGAKYTAWCPEVCDVITRWARDGRGGRGTVYVLAMSNKKQDNCEGSSKDTSSHPDAIAVSRSSAEDEFDDAGYGECLDVIAPGDLSRRMVAADVRGNLGYTWAKPAEDCVDPPNSNPNYTVCFGGTSAATPLVAGAAALVLAADSELSAQQVRFLLQDTADKIEPGSTATSIYKPENGFASKRGYGRLNAFEAVRVVAAPNAEPNEDGRGGADLFLRDNYLDWGNTEKPSTHRFGAGNRDEPYWESPDIRVDAPPWEAVPTTSEAFEDLRKENPVPGQTNKVYVRVRNRGPSEVREATVRLYWTPAGAGAQPLEAWNSLAADYLSDLAYSGASIAATAVDAAQIAAFSLGPASLEGTSHLSLFAVVASDGDEPGWNVTSTLVPHRYTRWDNNMTQRNVHIDHVPSSRTATRTFLVTNPFDEQTTARLDVKAPTGWDVTVSPHGFADEFSLQPEAAELHTLTIEIKPGATRGAVRILQKTDDPGGDDKRAMVTGVTYAFAPLEE